MISGMDGIEIWGRGGMDKVGMGMEISGMDGMGI